MKKFAKRILFFLALLISFLIAFNYHSDRPVEDLKRQYTYPDSKFVEVDDMDVHYRITGQGFPLVLLHGTASSLHTWEAWTNLLQADYKIVSLDLPAFGLTGEHPEHQYFMKNYVDFLDHFLKVVAVDSFYLAGNSLGGKIAWNYTIAHPEKVKKLVLIDAAGYPRDNEPPMSFKMAKSPFFSKIMVKITPKLLYRKSIQEVYHNDALVTDALVDRYFELGLREGNRQAFVDWVNQLDYPNTNLIKTIETPTLILWGKTDEWITVKNAHQFKEDLQNSELIIYDNSGHVPMEEIPEETARDVKSFLLKGGSRTLGN